MANGKVHHWKHGWIPIDAFAMAVVAEKKKPVAKKRTRKPANFVPQGDNVPKWKPPTAAEKKKLVADELAKTPTRTAAERQKAIADRMEELGRQAAIDARAEKSAAEMRRERYRTLTTVDGVDFVTYKDSNMDPMGTEHGEPATLTRDQMQPLADAYNEIKGEFPGLEPVQVVGVHNTGGAFGITSWDGRRISISDTLFDPDAIEAAHENWQDHGAIAGAFTDDPEGFARAVMTHELGHALQMQKAAARHHGELLADERVTAEQLGIDTSKWDDSSKNRTIPRWAADTLGGQSYYAINNQYEWFAEAFADAWFNGDKAQQQSQKVLAMLHQQYGKADAA